VQVVPGTAAVAGTGTASMQSLSRAANTGGLNDAARASQSQAKLALADAQRAKDPFGASNRARADSMTRQAEIQGLQATDVLPDVLDAGEAERLRNLSAADFRAETDQMRLKKEQEARGSEAAAAESGKGSKGDEVPATAEAGAPAETKQDSSQTMIGHLASIDKNMASVEKKLPQRALK